MILNLFQSKKVRKCSVCRNKMCRTEIGKLEGAVDLRFNMGTPDGWYRLMACSKCGVVQAVPRNLVEDVLGINMTPDIKNAELSEKTRQEAANTVAAKAQPVDPENN